MATGEASQGGGLDGGAGTGRRGEWAAPDRPGLGNRQQMEEECGAGQTRLRGSEEDPGLGAKPFNIRGPVPLLDSRGN